jgi:hypothetical protein
MRQQHVIRVVSLTFLLALLAVPVAHAGTRFSVQIGIGAPVGAWIAPGPYAVAPGYVWQPGYWASTPYGRQWIPGAWVRPYVQPRWAPGRRDRDWDRDRDRDRDWDRDGDRNRNRDRDRRDWRR